MKLRTVRVQNFKCIDDSETFSLESVTSLVGKNEAGKSAILQSLYKLNPVEKEAAAFNDVLEYPRRKWSEYSERREEEPDNVLTTERRLEDTDVEALTSLLGASGLKSRDVTITKGYANKSYWTIGIDEPQVVQHYLDSGGLFAEELDELKGIRTVSELIAKLDGINDPSEHYKALSQAVKAKIPKGSPTQSALGVLQPRLPKFLYFAEYDKLPGTVSIEALVARQKENKLLPGDKLFVALLRLAGRKPDDLAGIGQFEELIAELQAVSNRLSDEIFYYWTQNKHLRVEFRLDAGRPADPPPLNAGSIFRTRIWNDRHRVSVGFDERSTGFVWFFSFLVWFSQAKAEYGDNLIILLDEPGLGLHGKAQEDLLRYIRERLEPHFQVVYTAHSPFMIDPENLLRARTVEDVLKDDQVLGTKVGDKVLSTDADTIFPLQAVLGFNITQTLFVGEHTLLVEGPGDLLYLKWFSRELVTSNKVGLDKRWVISPAGGIDKIASFIALLGGNKLHLAVFTDFHKGDKRKTRELKESTLLQAGHFFSAEMFTGQEESDIEDMIGWENYLVLVNECYALSGGNRVTDGKQKKIHDLVVPFVEEHFRGLPDEIPEFDHYSPAEYLTVNGHDLEAKLSGLEEALDRFEDLFKKLNALLPS